MSSNFYNEAVYSLNLLLLSLLSFEMEVEQSYNFFIPKGYIIIVLQQEKVHSQLISKAHVRSTGNGHDSFTQNYIFSGLFVILLTSCTFVFIPRGSLAQA